MSKYDVAPRGEDWQRLREQLQTMVEMIERREMNLMDFAKSYEAAAKTIFVAVKDAGLSSLRLEAAAKALDLKTEKSKLVQFLAGDRDAE